MTQDERMVPRAEYDRMHDLAMARLEELIERDELLRKLEELVAGWEDRAEPVSWLTPLDLRRACANGLKAIISEAQEGKRDE